MGARTGNKFGWHSGTITCKDAKIEGDCYIQDDIVFSDVSAGTLGVTGGIDMQATTSAIGIDMGGTFSTAAINIDGTCGAAINETVTDATTNPSRLNYWQYTCTGNMSDGGATGLEIRSTFNGSANTSNGITGAEIKARHTTGNTYTVNQLRGIVGNADTKNGKTTTAYAVEGSIDVSAGGTITTSACFHGNLNNSGTVTTSYGAFLEGVSGYNLTKGIYMRYITTGLDIAACTTGLLVSGASTTAISVTGASTTGISITGDATDAIKIATGTITTALNVDVGVVDVATRVICSGASLAYNTPALSVGVYGAGLIDTLLGDSIMASVVSQTATNKTAADTSSMALYVGNRNTADTINTKMQGILSTMNIGYDVFDAYAGQFHIAITDTMATHDGNANLVGLACKASIANSKTATGNVSALYCVLGSDNATTGDVATGTLDAIRIENSSTQCDSAINFGATANMAFLLSMGSTGCVAASTTTTPGGNGYLIKVKIGSDTCYIRAPTSWS